MKNLLLAIPLFCVMAFLAGTPASAQNVQPYGQCGQTNFTPIQCGYYLEGSQDGAADAQNNRSNDYRRYRNKLDGSKYESFYRQGYDAGYGGVRPDERWTRIQRDNYDDGYRNGENDRRRSISRLPERYEGQYNRSFEAFFKQGYFDGYDNRSKQYDVPLGGVTPTYPTYPTNPSYPGNPTSPGTPTGTVSWRGRVDDRVNVIIQGSQVRNETLGGIGVSRVSQSMNGVLPNRQSTIYLNKRDGRGTAAVIQQPNRSNNYTAIVQIVDSKGGTDDYQLEISWQSNAQAEEPYQSGRVNWRGRVDQTANIVIAGGSVQTDDASATGVSGVSSNITGHLARRPGSISVRKIRGRGSVSVLQQPGADNDYVAVIQIFDNDRGEGEYEVEISW
jgi:hypothetical protein